MSLKIILCEEILKTKDKYVDLAPVEKKDLFDRYGEAIQWALDNKNIKNLAISGPYGSGKSSVIKSFEELGDHNYSFLNISLATFSDKKSKENDDKSSCHDENCEIKKTQKKINQNMLIERSILQQMIYKKSSRLFPESRFKRVEQNPISPEKIFAFIINAMLLFLFKTYVVNLSLLSQKFSLAVLIVFGVAWGLYSAYVLTDLVVACSKWVKSVSLKKLNLFKGEIELGESDEKSVLNKHIDEIIYFFQVTDYNVVVIEDLDRFEECEIFVKMREINTLINTSDLVTQDVTFVYAIKDEIFLKHKERTKFFEFIIPVIPVVSTKNARDKLFERLAHPDLKELDFPKRFIRDVSLYLNDMRLINNIVNEFHLYWNQKNVQLKPHKLLAILIYKNCYPEDFAKLHKGDGVLYHAFQNKHQLIDAQIVTIDSELETLNKNIADIQKERINSIDELRAIYINQIYNTIPDNSSNHSNSTKYTKIQIEGIELKIQDLREESNFQFLIDSNKFLGNPNQNGNKEYRFSDIEKKVSDLSYLEREKRVIGKANNEKQNLLLKKANYENQKKNLERSPLKELLTDNSDFDLLYEKDDLKDDSLLRYLLRNGHVDEHYQNYISYFYAGTISRNDMNFVLSIRNHEPLPYDYELNDCTEIIEEELDISDFNQKEILNFTLINYLVEFSGKYKDQCIQLITFLSEKPIDACKFLHQYIDKCERNMTFFDLICANWPTVWSDINLYSRFDESLKEKVLFEILMSDSRQHIEDIPEEIKMISKYIAENPKAFSAPKSDYEERYLRSFYKKHRVKVKNISNIDNENFMKFLYDENLYALISDNIEVILPIVGKVDLANLQKANLTTILNGNYYKLIWYIKEDLENYVLNVFLELETNVEESEEAIRMLLGSDLSTDIKFKVIEKENTLLSSLDELEEELRDHIISERKVQITWGLILDYYGSKSKEINDVLLGILNDSVIVEVLSKECFGEGDVEDALAVSIMTCNEIVDENYKLLLKSIYGQYKSLDISGLSKEKALALVKHPILALTIENYDALDESFHLLELELLVVHISEYLDNLDSFAVNNIQWKILLNSSISVQQKLRLIENLEIEVLEDNSELANTIMKIINKKPDSLELQSEFIFELIINGSDLAERLKLFTEHINLCDENKITELLESMPEEYQKISQFQQQPTFTNDSINQKFLTTLYEKEYCSEPKVVKGKLKVYAKKHE